MEELNHGPTGSEAKDIPASDQKKMKYSNCRNFILQPIKKRGADFQVVKA